MKSRPVRRNRVALLCLLALLSIGSIAQKESARPAPYALIAGTVWTAQDRSAPGVTVKIRRSDDQPGKARWELVTNARGEFSQRVPAEKAEYIVWVESRGHKAPAAQTTVQIEGDEYLDIGLHLTE
jgi:hypothetical protein